MYISVNDFQEILQYEKRELLTLNTYIILSEFSQIYKIKKIRLLSQQSDF